MIVAIGIWLVLCLVVGGAIFFAQPSQVIEVVPSAVVTVIVAPTPTIEVKAAAPTAVSEAQTDDQNQGNKLPVLLNKGDYVQILGTDNQGLSFRSAPGVENKTLFVAMEDEVFEVKDGPVSSSGYNWWYLVSPTDPNLYGWAVDDFLKLAPKP